MARAALLFCLSLFLWASPLAASFWRRHDCRVTCDDASKETHLMLAERMGFPTHLASIRRLRSYQREYQRRLQYDDFMAVDLMPVPDLYAAWLQYQLDEDLVPEPREYHWLFDVGLSNLYFRPGRDEKTLRVLGRVIATDDVPAPEESKPELAISRLFPNGRPAGLVLARLAIRKRVSFLPHPASFVFDAEIRLAP